MCWQKGQAHSYILAYPCKYSLITGSPGRLKLATNHLICVPTGYQLMPLTRAPMGKHLPCKSPLQPAVLAEVLEDTAGIAAAQSQPSTAELTLGAR